jgi:PD-(D/E)XK nuclease superfamily protein
MPISFSNTRLTTFKRCRLKYHWQYVDKQPNHESPALRRGRAAHKAMAGYYSGLSPRKAILEAWREFDPFDPISYAKMLELDTILTRYFDWAKLNDNWKVLKVEETIEAKYGRHHLMGIWDLLVDKRGKKFIVDHKFQKSHTFSNLEVDPQVSHYLALAKLAGIEVHGLIYNIVNLELGETKNIAFREITGRQDYFIDAYLESLVPQIKEIKQAEKGKFPIYPNWTGDCCWQCSWYKKCLQEPYRQP